MKQTTIQDFLTDEQIKQAISLYKTAPEGSFATRCAEEIIAPNLAEINAKLGQENDAKFLAYAVEYAFMLAQGR